MFLPAAVLEAVSSRETTKYFGTTTIDGHTWIFTGCWAIRHDREPDQVTKLKDCRDWEVKPPLAEVLAPIDARAAKPVTRTASEVERPGWAPTILYAGDRVEVGIAQPFVGLLDCCAEIRASGEHDAVMGLDATGELVAVVMPVRL